MERNFHIHTYTQPFGAGVAALLIKPSLTLQSKMHAAWSADYIALQHAPC